MFRCGCARDQALDHAANRVVAREAAEQSMVLLINRHNTLPLALGPGKAHVNTLALVGPASPSHAPK